MTALYMMDMGTCIYLKNRRPPAIAERFRSLYNRVMLLCPLLLMVNCIMAR